MLFKVPLKDEDTTVSPTPSLLLVVLPDEAEHSPSSQVALIAEHGGNIFILVPGLLPP